MAKVTLWPTTEGSSEESTTVLVERPEACAGWKRKTFAPITTPPMRRTATPLAAALNLFGI
jgi:hypothetical protein